MAFQDELSRPRLDFIVFVDHGLEFRVREDSNLALSGWEEDLLAAPAECHLINLYRLLVGREDCG